MKPQNPNCDGSHCRSESGEVRVYPLGAGGNLILCRSCWENENRYRRERGREHRNPENWPEVAWDAAEVYAPARPQEGRR